MVKQALTLMKSTLAKTKKNSNKENSRAGFTRFPNFIFELELKDSELLVLLVLYFHLPNSHPSIIRISRLSRLSESTVKRSIKSLTLKKLIFIERTNNQNNNYVLHEDSSTFFLVDNFTSGGHPDLRLGSRAVRSGGQNTPKAEVTLTSKQDKEQDKEQEDFFKKITEEEIEERKKLVLSSIYKKI